ncbi:nitronate monooxygenase [Streptomyces sp. NPDC051742]|uniref:nitronate monooxygenase n=1 Tax=Streptomyces sp. NPDC051742 TaxID=3155169 RepID=UPI00342D954D
MPCDAWTPAVIDSGGIVTGSGLAVVLALGACAVTMGTCFVASAEAPVHQNVKGQTVVDRWALGRSHPASSAVPPFHGECIATIENAWPGEGSARHAGARLGFRAAGGHDHAFRVVPTTAGASGSTPRARVLGARAGCGGGGEPAEAKSPTCGSRALPTAAAINSKSIRNQIVRSSGSD